MSDELTFEQAAHSLTDYLNDELPRTVLEVSRKLGDAPDAQSAKVLGIDPSGVDLSITGENELVKFVRIDFPHPAADPNDMRGMLMGLVDSVDEADGVARVATARVETPRASRYLRALCNHFDRKVQAEYDDNEGHIHFPFGECELRAEADALLITVSADSEVRMARTRHVVADHLLRFAQKETLQVDWVTVEGIGALEIGGVETGD